jgi:hypothetical protein
MWLNIQDWEYCEDYSQVIIGIGLQEYVGGCGWL